MTFAGAPNLKTQLRHYDVPRLVAPALGGLGDAATLQRAKTARQASFVARASSQLPGLNAAVKTVSFAKPTRAPAIVGGKVQTQAPVESFWAQWNGEAAKLIVPVASTINALPVPTSVKTQLRTRPLDALLDIFDPFEEAFGRAIDRVLAKNGNTQVFFGQSRNLKRVQKIDAIADVSTQNLMRRLRTIDAFMVLFWTQPVDLAVECAAEGVNIAGTAAGAIADAASNVARAAGQAAAVVLQAGQDAANEVASWFGLGSTGLGDPTGGAATTAAVTGTAAVAAPAVDATLTLIITSITSIITSIGSAAVLALLNGEDPKAAAAAAATTSISAEAERRAGLPPGSLSTTFAPREAPASSSTSLTVAPPVTVRLPPSSAPSVPSTPSISQPASGGVSPVVVLGGAIALGFLLTRAMR